MLPPILGRWPQKVSAGRSNRQFAFLVRRASLLEPRSAWGLGNASRAHFHEKHYHGARPPFKSRGANWAGDSNAVPAVVGSARCKPVGSFPCDGGAGPPFSSIPAFFLARTACPLLARAAGHAQALQRWLLMGGNPSALDRQSGRGTLLFAAAQADQAECLKVRTGEGGQQGCGL